MKEHEFKIRHDKVTGEWLVWVKVPFFFFWTCWQPVVKKNHGIWHELRFTSEADCMAGIERWKLEHAPEWQRYQTTHHKM